MEDFTFVQDSEFIDLVEFYYWQSDLCLPDEDMETYFDCAEECLLYNFIFNSAEADELFANKEGDRVMAFFDIETETLQDIINQEMRDYERARFLGLE